MPRSRTPEELCAHRKREANRIREHRKSENKRKHRDTILRLLDEPGYCTVDLERVGGELLTLEFLRELVSNVPDEDFDPLVQNPLEEDEDARFGDKLRLICELGLQDCPREGRLHELLQGMHDRIFLIDEEPTPVQEGTHPSDAEAEKTTAHAGKEEPVLRRSTRRKTATPTPAEPRTAATQRKRRQPSSLKWTKSFKLRRIVHPAGARHNRTVRTAAILRSKPRCRRQGKHLDWVFGPHKQLLRLGYINFFMPVSHVTRLVVWDNSHKLVERELELDLLGAGSSSGEWHCDETRRLQWASANDIVSRHGTITGRYITVAPGQVLIFHGQLVHAGAEWDAVEGADNCRVHAYFVPHDKSFPADTVTYNCPTWINTVCLWPEEGGGGESSALSLASSYC